MAVNIRTTVILTCEQQLSLATVVYIRMQRFLILSFNQNLLCGWQRSQKDGGNNVSIQKGCEGRWDS